MKKYILPVLFVLILLAKSATSSQAQNNQAPSLFSSSYGTDTGLQTKLWEEGIFTGATFDTQIVGIYKLIGDWFMPNHYSGLVRISGNCTQQKAADVTVYAMTDKGFYYLAKNAEDVFELVPLVIPAKDVKIGAMQTGGAEVWDMLHCSFLFEAVR